MATGYVGGTGPRAAHRAGGFVPRGRSAPMVVVRVTLPGTPYHRVVRGEASLARPRRQDRKWSAGSPVLRIARFGNAWSRVDRSRDGGRHHVARDDARRRARARGRTRPTEARMRSWPRRSARPSVREAPPARPSSSAPPPRRPGTAGCGKSWPGERRCARGAVPASAGPPLHRTGALRRAPRPGTSVDGESPGTSADCHGRRGIPGHLTVSAFPARPARPAGPARSEVRSGSSGRLRFPARGERAAARRDAERAIGPRCSGRDGASAESGAVRPGRSPAGGLVSR